MGFNSAFKGLNVSVLQYSNQEKSDFLIAIYEPKVTIYSIFHLK